MIRRALVAILASTLLVPLGLFLSASQALAGPYSQGCCGVGWSGIDDQVFLVCGVLWDSLLETPGAINVYTAESNQACLTQQGVSNNSYFVDDLEYSLDNVNWNTWSADWGPFTTDHNLNWSEPVGSGRIEYVRICGGIDLDGTNTLENVVCSPSLPFNA